MYFNLFRHEIVWPRWLCLSLVALALILLTFAAIYRVPRLRGEAVLRGAATLAVTVLLTAAFGCALLWALFPMALLGPQFPAHPMPSMVAFSALAFAIGLGALAVTGIAALVAAMSPDYSAAAPLPLNLSCVQNGTGPVRWVTAVRKKNVSLIPDLMRVGGFSPEPHPEALFPWASKQALLYSSPAAIETLPDVNLQVLEKSMRGSTLCFHARLNAPPAVDRIFLQFPPTASMQSMAIGGQMLPHIPPAGWKRFTTTPFHGGNDVSFCLDAEGSTDLYVAAVSYGLPPAGQKLIDARGNAASKSQDADLTEHLQHVQLLPR